MKRSISPILLSMIFLSMTFTPCQSQSENRKPQIGVLAGLNLSNLYTDNASHTDMMAGFNVGVFVRNPITGLITIEPELYLTTKGATITYNDLIINGTADFRLTYLELPVLITLNATRFVNLQFGPYMSYLIDNKVTNQANVNLYNFEKDINTSNYNPVDAGVVLGVGVSVGSTTMGARYNLGLTKIGKPKTFLGTAYTIPNSNNGVINFFLAVSF